MAERHPTLAAELADAAQGEVAEKKAPRARPSWTMSRVWKIIELYTWSCAMSHVEPISLEPGWDLNIPVVQEPAMVHRKETEPDSLSLPGHVDHGFHCKGSTGRRRYSGKPCIRNSGWAVVSFSHL